MRYQYTHRSYPPEYLKTVYATTYTGKTGSAHEDTLQRGKVFMVAINQATSEVIVAPYNTAQERQDAVKVSLRFNSDDYYCFLMRALDEADAVSHAAAACIQRNQAFNDILAQLRSAK